MSRPVLSTRSQEIPASPIRRLVPYAMEAKSRGILVHHLNIGQPDIATPPEFFKAIRDFSDGVLAYSQSTGVLSYIEALIEYYRELNLDVSPAMILPTFGASEAIIFAMQIAGNHGQEILIPEPFYANYICFAIMAGLKIIPVPTTAEDDFHLPDEATLQQLVTENTCAILINTPNNPTGRVYDQSEITSIRNIALKNNLFLICDEVYREFLFDGRRHISLMNIPELEQHTILVDSISKVFSACGARVGCLMSRNREVTTAALKLSQGRLCVATLDQIGAAAAYRARKQYLPPVVKRYLGRRDTLFSELHGIPGIRCNKPGGAFYTLVELPVDDAETFIIWMLQEFEVDGETVMMAPGEGFYQTSGSGRRQVRIAYVLEEEKLVRATHILAAGLDAYPGRR